jgi:hypothetical protein
MGCCDTSDRKDGSDTLSQKSKKSTEFQQNSMKSTEFQEIHRNRSDEILMRFDEISLMSFGKLIAL